MAEYINGSNGNWSSTSTWRTIETANNARLLTRTNSTNTTTSYVQTGAFNVTNGKITDGVLMYCNRINTTGTVSVALFHSTDSFATPIVVGGTTSIITTINASDLSTSPGWVFFKWPTNVTLNGSLTYRIGIRGSSAANATFFRDVTAANWSRLLRFTDNASTLSPTIPSVASRSLTGNIVTITTSSPHGFSSGQFVTVDLVDTLDFVFNGCWSISSVPTATTFTYSRTFRNVLTTDGTFTSGKVTSHTSTVGNVDSFYITGEWLSANTFNSYTVTMDLTPSTSPTSDQLFGQIDVCSKGIVAYGTSSSANYRLRVGGNINIWPGGVWQMGSSETPIPRTSTAELEMQGVGNTTATTYLITNNGTFRTYGTYQNSSTGNTKIYYSTLNADFSNPILISQASLSSNVATITTSSAHGFIVGDTVIINMDTPDIYNGTYTIATVPTSTTFTYARTWGANITNISNPGTVTKANAANTQISIVDTTTNWEANDFIGIASTTTTQTQAEARLISSVSGGTLTFANGLRSTHSGTSPIQGIVVNTTRNVKVRNNTVAGPIRYLTTSSGSPSQNSTFINDVLGIMDCNFSEFAALGTATAGRRGITLSQTTGNGGSVSFIGCSFHDFSSNGSIECSGSTWDNLTVNNCTFWNMQSNAFIADATTGTTISLSNCYSVSTGTFINSSDARMNLSNSIIFNANIGVAILESNADTTLTNVTIACGSNDGIRFSSTTKNVTLTNITLWRNSGNGLSIQGYCQDCLVDTITCFGNTTSGISLSGPMSRIIIKTFNLYGGTTTVQPIGINLAFTNVVYYDMTFLNGTLGSPSQHSTADIQLSSTVNVSYYNIKMNNILFGSSTEISNTSSMTQPSRIGIYRYDQTANNHKLIQAHGTITSDLSTYKSGPPSERLTPTAVPTTGRLRLESSPKRVALNSGTNTTISVWVKKSTVGEGGAYNGSQPRLMMRANPGAGFNDDVVLATATAASDGTFEQLSSLIPSTVSENTVLEFYVDCNGTAGWVNVDDWSAV